MRENSVYQHFLLFQTIFSNQFFNRVLGILENFQKKLNSKSKFLFRRKKSFHKTEFRFFFVFFWGGGGEEGKIQDKIASSLQTDLGSTLLAKVHRAAHSKQRVNPDKFIVDLSFSA